MKGKSFYKTIGQWQERYDKLQQDQEFPQAKFCLVMKRHYLKSYLQFPASQECLVGHINDLRMITLQRWDSQSLQN